jgi:hypothetical protein
MIIHCNHRIVIFLYCQCCTVNTHLKAFAAAESILKFHNGNSVLPVHILFSYFLTAVSIFIPIY